MYASMTESIRRTKTTMTTMFDKGRRRRQCSTTTTMFDDYDNVRQKMTKKTMKRKYFNIVCCLFVNVALIIPSSRSYRTFSRMCTEMYDRVMLPSRREWLSELPHVSERRQGSLPWYHTTVCLWNHVGRPTETKENYLWYSNKCYLLNR